MKGSILLYTDYDNAKGKNLLAPSCSIRYEKQII